MSAGLFEIPVAILAKAIVDVLRKTRASIEITPSGGISASIKLPVSQRNIDERLKMIGQARENLTEALQAIDDLQETAEDNRRDLANLNQAILRAEEQKAGLAAELTALKGLADLDSKAVREALRLPTEVDKWKERIWGFIFGLLAGLTATLLWELAIKPSLPEKFFPDPTAVSVPADNTKTK